MTEQIYLDHNASTPIAPEVRDAMLPLLEEAQGNPSSSHWAGRPARAAVQKAREQVAALIGASPAEIVLTSGGSEANNTALKGVWYAAGKPGAVVAISAVEHPATVEPARFLAVHGAELAILPVDETCRVAPDALDVLAGRELRLLSVMHANNEVGTLQPISELAAAAHAVGAVVHCDAAQSVGKVPVDVERLGVDLLSIAGHKLHAPKGIGALYVRSGLKLESLIHGAGHESGRRAGTESALLAAGLGAACELAASHLAGSAMVRDLRDGLWARLCAGLGDSVVRLGHPEHVLPNTLAVGFRGCVGGGILDRCPGLAASTGAACHGGGRDISATLRAMAVDPEIAAGSVRLSLGYETTAAEVIAAADMLIAAAREIESGRSG